MVASADITNGSYIDIQPGFYSQSSNYKIIYGNCVNGDAEKPTCDFQQEVQAQMGAAFVLDLINSSSPAVLFCLHLILSNVSANTIGSVQQRKHSVATSSSICYNGR